MVEVIVIMNREGQILDIAPRWVKMVNLEEVERKEVFDDGELIRLKVEVKA
jgi:hypothetical protein